jgi:hypothetical protein
MPGPPEWPSQESRARFAAEAAKLQRISGFLPTRPAGALAKKRRPTRLARQCRPLTA